MKKAFFTCSMVISVLALFSVIQTAQAVENCEQYGTVDVKDGEYTVQNNVWGSSASQCVDAFETGFTVTKADHNQNDVAAYPSIYKGCHWETCTKGSGMPIQVSSVNSAEISWSTSLISSGKWNVTTEAWINQSSNPGEPDGAELMIWINAHGDPYPGGSKVGDANIEGASWEVYYTNIGWNFVTYKRSGYTTSLNIDYKPFMNDAVSRGYVQNSWYLMVIEAGFELFQGGSGLKTSSFSCSINGQVGPIKYKLSVTTQGSGSVSRSPNEPGYDQGTTVTLTATPSNGYIFVGWSGDLSGSENPAQIVVNTDKNVTATFEQSTQDPPTVSITSPSQGQSCDQGESVTISADASDSDGSVTKVEFLVNGSVIGEDASSPYSINWTPGLAGSYTLIARATDNEGASTLSSEVTVTVKSSTKPPEGENLALNKPVTASSVEDGESEFAAENVVDGSTTSRWSSDFSDPQWIRVDLQSTYTINRVILNWEDAYAIDYEVQVSNDGNNWTTVSTIMGSDGDKDDIFLSATEARYVRVYGTERATSYGYSLYEFEVYGQVTKIGPGIDNANKSEQNKMSVNIQTIEQGSIQFRLYSPQHISLDILDTRGAKKAALFCGFLNKGGHHVTIPPHALSRGVYVILLKGEKFKTSRKFLNVRD